MSSRGVVPFLVLGLAASGCVLEWDRLRSTGDSSIPEDTDPLDTGAPDTELPDLGDALEEPDGGGRTDASGLDGPRDTAPDTARDALPETLDARLDGPMDVPSEPPADTSRDTGTAPDTALDTAPRDSAPADTTPEATPDARPDTAPDAVPDSAPDAPPSGMLCTPPTVDGVVGADWTDATSVLLRNTTATGWGAGLNELRALRVCYSTSALFLGLEGTVEDANAMVVYLDLDVPPPGMPTGVLAFSELTDTNGALDRRITAAYTLTGMASGVFGLDAAWGTVGMTSLAASATAENTGLRLVTPGGRRADFAWTPGVTSVCAPRMGCEVSLSWMGLYGSSTPPSRALGLFVRINATDGTMTSNQTLPMDDPAAPRNIGRYLRVDLRF